MQLFQNPSAGGTVNRYSTNVKPVLDQQQQNMQFNNDISNIQTQVQPLTAPPRQDQEPLPTPYDLNAPETAPPAASRRSPCSGPRR